MNATALLLVLGGIFVILNAANFVDVLKGNSKISFLNPTSAGAGAETTTDNSGSGNTSTTGNLPGSGTGATGSTRVGGTGGT